MAEFVSSFVQLVYCERESRFFNLHTNVDLQGAVLISLNECAAVGDLYRVMERKYPQRDDILVAIRRLREALLKCSALAGFPRVRLSIRARLTIGYQRTLCFERSYTEGNTRCFRSDTSSSVFNFPLHLTQDRGILLQSVSILVERRTSPLYIQPLIRPRLSPIWPRHIPICLSLL